MNKHFDWTRLLPRPKTMPNTTAGDQARFTYLFEFLRHNKGSKTAKEKAFKEMQALCKSCTAQSAT